METITLFDTAVGSTNKGDEIIMKCVEEELDWLLSGNFVLRAPTHLAAFREIECLGGLPDSAAEIARSKYKIVCGTNLLSDRMANRTNQWNINRWNSKPLTGCVLLGVGALAGEEPDGYTQKLYRSVLSHDLYHSVRDAKAYRLLTSMGLKCLNTGCVTLWKLTPAFCRQIPNGKGRAVVFTLTDYRTDPQWDRQLLEILRRSYDTLYFWVQGLHDLEYLQSLGAVEDIRILPPSVAAYEQILDSGVDYVGTRLHAGIFALRHRVRATILTVDDRMESMAGCIPNNCVSRTDLRRLEEKIHSDFETRVNVDWDAIRMWKGQFSE